MSQTRESHSFCHALLLSLPRATISSTRQASQTQCVTVALSYFKESLLSIGYMLGTVEGSWHTSFNLVQSHFNKWEIWSSEKPNSLPEVTKLERHQPQTQILAAVPTNQSKRSTKCLKTSFISIMIVNPTLSPPLLSHVLTKLPTFSEFNCLAEFI